jgi:hypothetical protein
MNDEILAYIEQRAGDVRRRKRYRAARDEDRFFPWFYANGGMVTAAGLWAVAYLFVLHATC